MWQGGLTNEQLLEKWKEKLPNREPVGDELSAFALGIEIGVSLAGGPDFEDGHDCQGFVGGCERMGCEGDTPCLVCNANGAFKYGPDENCICQGNAWLWKLG